jgi:hypothetical protein
MAVTSMKSPSDAQLRYRRAQSLDEANRQIEELYRRLDELFRLLRADVAKNRQDLDTLL